MALNLDLHVGESVSIDDGRVTVTLKDKSGKRARLEFEADRSVSIKKVNTAGTHIAAGGLSKPAMSTG